MSHQAVYFRVGFAAVDVIYSSNEIEFIGNVEHLQHTVGLAAVGGGGQADVGREADRPARYAGSPSRMNDAQ